MVTCKDIYRLYSLVRPESEIHQAYREVPTDDRDESLGGGCCTPLHLACSFADEGAVRILLERGIGTNEKDNRGYTPLCCLGMSRYRVADEDIMASITALLIEHGASVPRSAKYTTALIEAIQNRHFKMAEIIVNSGCRIDSTNNSGENVLHIACRSAADINYDLRQVEKNLALSLAIQYSDEKKERLKAEADAEMENLREEGREALNFIRRLLESNMIDPEDKTDYGKTAWDIAAEGNALNIAALLSGNDPEHDELSALHGGMDIFQALYNKNIKAVEALLRSGIELQTVCEHKEMSDFYGKSPLACALSWFGVLFEAAGMLIKAGADINYRFPDEKTAFSAWVRNDSQSGNTEQYIRILKEMTLCGWNPESSVDKEGNTSLAFACRFVYKKKGKTAVQYLLKNGVAVNAVNLSGQTPLMILYGGCYWDGNIPKHLQSRSYPYGWTVNGDDEAEILEMLLEAGADTGKRDNWGNTLLHYIAASCWDTGAKKAIEILLDFKLPDPKIVNNEGLTAMDIAAEKNNEILVKFLLKYS